MRIGSLFSGIGGLELGLEAAGLGPVLWQVEKDPFCRSVLEKHWPNCERFDDVAAFADTIERDPLAVPCPDVVCGGFPCQDISDAGLRAGIDGARSGLWSEYARVIRLLRPRFVVVENVAALLGRGMGRVLGDLAACGYDAEWACIQAADVGAPHGRDRVWILAYPDEHRQQDERRGALRDHIVAPSRADADGRGAARTWPPPQGAMRLWGGCRPRLNPRFVEALMGMPQGWTACELSATQSSPTSPK